MCLKSLWTQWAFTRQLLRDSWMLWHWTLGACQHSTIFDYKKAISYGPKVISSGASPCRSIHFHTILRLCFLGPPPVPNILNCILKEAELKTWIWMQLRFPRNKRWASEKGKVTERDNYWVAAMGKKDSATPRHFKEQNRCPRFVHLMRGRWGYISIHSCLLSGWLAKGLLAPHLYENWVAPVV